MQGRLGRLVVRRVDGRQSGSARPIGRGVSPQHSAERVTESGPEPAAKCPHDSVVMMRHFWSVKRDVVVDECPKCEGIFLDPGELAAIRTDYKSDAERHKAAEAYYSEMFDQQLAGMLRQDKAKLESGRRVARIFKFICPSYYIPGKQAWGAF